MNNIVLTGPPCSGKTTVMHELSALGYTVVPETARMEIIARKVRHDQDTAVVDTDEIVSAPDFQTEVIQRRLAAEARNGIDTGEIVICDRSLLDNIAYKRYFGERVPPYLRQLAEERYDHVLYLEGLPLEQDGIRHENPSERDKLANLLKEAYTESYNDQLTTIAVADVEKRVKQIVSEIEMHTEYERH